LGMGPESNSTFLRERGPLHETRDRRIVGNVFFQPSPGTSEQFAAFFGAFDPVSHQVMRLVEDPEQRIVDGDVLSDSDLLIAYTRDSGDETPEGPRRGARCEIRRAMQGRSDVIVEAGTHPLAVHVAE